ncbi:hypothetical protein QFZ77_007550 [Paenibacillus sp. V4I3]|uniref:hypothetical protein n=1 Tax=unclassified Paenibacillus TaxID=185978 RepID=UPI00278AB794|nr:MULTISPECIES: hypothetical protein [unclassified Paenibacillus]MDQ0878837.1 hypothetical protein [Paenibacillus sp. V4I3]MDQ0878891.1 hypothetical protein [Paenibacillus sp. V4I3]MDQ0888844.1 hypothetical protein [Paenibacillus sp. V4I9]
MKGGLKLFAMLVFLFGFPAIIALTGVFGLVIGIFSPLILSYIFLVKRLESRRQALGVLVGQCLLGALVLGMLIGKVSDNGLLVAEGIYAVAMVVFNFVMRNPAPYWKKKWKDYRN